MTARPILAAAVFAVWTLAAAPFPEKGGTLRFNGGSSPKSYNAYVDNNSYTMMTFSMMYETLLDSDPDTLDFEPAIASGWEVAGSRFAFSIDERARWSDGEPVTARDVKWTFDAIMDPGNDTGPWKTILGGFESPSADGDRKIEFRKAESGGRDWRDLMTLGTFPVLPAHAFAGKDFSKLRLVGAPVSGPYSLARVEPEIECELRRDGGWWRADFPRCRDFFNFDRIILRYFAESQNAFEAFKDRKIDVFPVYTARIMARETGGEAFAKNWIVKRRFRNHAPVGFQGFAMNMRRKPFDDLRVRRAMAKLLDREKLNSTLMFNEYFLLSSYYQDIWDDRHECPNERFSFDPAGARALLEEAGLGNGFSFTFLSRSSMEDKFLAPFSEALAKLGVKMEIVRKDFAGWMRDMDEFNYDMTWASWGAGVFKQPESMWLSSDADRRGSNNITGFKSAEVDRLIALEKTMETMAERVEAYRKIDELVAAEVPYILLWQVGERRILYWNKFGMPKGGLSRYGDEESALKTWWYDPDRAEELDAAIRASRCLPKIGEIVDFDVEAK